MNKVYYKNILEVQKFELNKLSEQNFIARDIENEIKADLNTKLIKVITGPRRAGKSVLSLRLISELNFAYINFDDERLISINAENMQDLFEILLEVSPKPDILFFDEIQNIDKWELFINRLQRLGYNIIITGSNSNLLSKELSTHLTGRFIKFELMPFSFKEFLRYNNFNLELANIHNPEIKSRLKKLFDEFMRTGGFPESFSLINNKEYLIELYHSVIMKDVIARYNLRYIREMKELSLFLLSNYSSKFSYNKLQKMFNIGSVHTIKKYIDYIEESYMFFQLNKFSYKIREQITANKKLYCIDQGVINTLAFNAIESHGRLLENIVFLHLKRNHSDLYYANIENKHEIDFVVRDGINFEKLIQVSYVIDNQKTINREYSALIEGSKLFKTDTLLVITYDTEDELLYHGKKIKIIPIWKYLLGF